MKTVFSALKKSLNINCKTNSPNDVHEPKIACKSKTVEKPKPDTTQRSRSRSDANVDHKNTSFDFSKCRGSSSRRSKPTVPEKNIQKLTKEASDYRGSARSNLGDGKSASARFSQSSQSIFRSLSQRKHSSKSPNGAGEYPKSSCMFTPPNKKAHMSVTFEINGDDGAGDDGASSFRTPRSCASSEYAVTGRRTPPYRKAHLPTSDKEQDEFGSRGFRMKFEDSNDAGDTARYDSFCAQCVKQVGEGEIIYSKHAVTQVVEDAVVECRSPCVVIEKICQIKWSVSGSKGYPGVARVLKINSLRKAKNQYKEYQEMVKSRARELPEEHSRTVVDGTELRRFYGTIVECPLGMNGSSNLCPSAKCRVCRILESGFLSEEGFSDGIGVLMTYTCDRALQTIEPSDQNQRTKAALIVCNVIAGLPENSPNGANQPEFELDENFYILDPRAILPLFVVILR